MSVVVVVIDVQSPGDRPALVLVPFTFFVGVSMILSMSRVTFGLSMLVAIVSQCRCELVWLRYFAFVLVFVFSFVARTVGLKTCFAIDTILPFLHY